MQNDVRGACKKCGMVGHLTFQCRNHLGMQDQTKVSSSDSSVRTRSSLPRTLQRGRGMLICILVCEWCICRTLLPARKIRLLLHHLRTTHRTMRGSALVELRHQRRLARRREEVAARADREVRVHGSVVATASETLALAVEVPVPTIIPSANQLGIEARVQSAVVAIRVAARVWSDRASGSAVATLKRRSMPTTGGRGSAKNPASETIHHLEREARRTRKSDRRNRRRRNTGKRRRVAENAAAASRMQNRRRDVIEKKRRGLEHQTADR